MFLLYTTLLLSVTASWTRREGYDVTSLYGHYCQRGKVYVALPWDCNGFIQCTPKSDGTFFAKWMPCAWHLQYNSNDHVCVYGRGSCTNMTKVALENCELNPDLKFAHPEHCALYYDCKQTAIVGGLEIYQNECPYPELFDEGKQKCEPSNLVNCNKRHIPTGKCDYKLGCNSTFCTQRNDGRYSVPGEEFGKEFIICINNTIDGQGFCSGETEVFDPVYKKCTSSYEGSIVLFCEKKSSAVFEDKSKCSQFYDCSKENHHGSMKRFQSECRYPLLFDSQKKACQPYDQVECGIRPEPVKPCDYKFGRCIDSQCIPCETACGPNDVGDYPHPFDEFKYLMCKDGRTIDIRSCPLGKKFDPNIQKCAPGCNCAAEIQALALMIKSVEVFLEDEGLPAMTCDKPLQNILRQTKQRTHPGAKLMSCLQPYKLCPEKQSLTCSAGRIVGKWNPSDTYWCSKVDICS